MKLFFTFVIFFLCHFFVFAHDFTLIGGLDNLAFFPKDASAVPKYDPEKLKPNLEAAFTGEFSGVAKYRLAFDADTILRYGISGEAEFNFTPVVIGLGTFVCFSDDSDYRLFPGFIAALGFDLPAGIFIRAKTILSITEDLRKTGNLGFHYDHVLAGFHVPNVLFSVNFDYKKFDDLRALKSTELIIEDSLKRTWLQFDFFAKSIPLNIQLTAGYEELIVYYKEIDQNETIGVMFGGAVLTFIFSTSFALVAGGEIPFSVEPKYSQYAYTFFYKARGGFIIKLAD
jgi:hypothetical protein